MRVPSGTVVSKYRIEREIDRDTLGTIYQARYGKDLYRIRILNTALTVDESKLDALFENGNYLVKTQHPIMARVTEIGEGEDGVAGLYYIASEWIDFNDTLAQVSRQYGALSPKDAAAFIKNLANSFVRLHKSGVVHSGLNPENIAITIGLNEIDWIPKISEFIVQGLYCDQLDEKVQHFIAPELFQDSRPGPRSDIYSIGILFMWLMTGISVYDKTTVEMLEKLPDEGRRVIQQALHPEVSSRFQDMERFYSALSQVNWPDEKLISVNPYELDIEVDKDTKRIIIIKDANGNVVEEVPFSKNRMTIGRSTYDMIQLQGDSIDDEHLEISFTRGRCFVNALSERSKTYLNGLPMTPKLNQAWNMEHDLTLGKYTINWAYEQSRVQNPYFNAVPEANLTMNLAPTNTIRVNPGGTAVTDLMIRNESEQIVSLNIQINDLPAEWIGYDRNRFKLGGLQTINIPIGFNPPQESKVAEGNHPFRIQLNVLEGGEGSFSCNGRLEISPYQNTHVEFSPTPWQHKEAGQAVIFNNGNTTVKYKLEGVGKTDEIDFEFSESEITIPAGRHYEVEVIPQMRRRPWYGERRLATYDLLLQAPKGEEMVSRGQLFVKPILSLPRIPPAVILTGALLLLILFALFARPPACRNYFNQNGEFWHHFLFCDRLDQEIVAPPIIPESTAVPPENEVETSGVANLSPTVTFTPNEVDSESVTSPFVTWPSTNGTTISAYKFGNGGNAVIFIGGIHAGRSQSSVSLVNQMIEHYQQPENAAAIPPNVSVYIVDNLNPDSVGSDRGRYNPNGVDINRNGSCEFQAGTSNDPVPQPSGDSPYSEPETQGLKNLYDMIGQISAVIFYDSGQGLPPGASPGVCPGKGGGGSEELAQLYAGNAGIVKEQAGNRSGDLSNSALELDAESIFVLLADPANANINQHLPAISETLKRMN